METSAESIFLSLPHEILVELLLLIPTSAIINFYSVNSTHLKLFDDQHGLWEQLARKIFQWGALETPVQGRFSSIIKNKAQTATNWKKEFRIASYIQERLHNATFVATYREKFVNIDKEQIKGIHPPAAVEDMATEEICYESVVQSDTVLYPHPIGDFSTAYFEVKIVTKVNLEARMDITSIGGALEGIVTVPGTAKSSYGITDVPDVFLECDYTPLHELARPLDTDDYMGFGINFVKNSIFFTVNGNIVHETATNISDLPLQNLKNLHATIAVFRDEVSVNMGSRPFIFDLLKYQQQNRSGAKAQFRLFSEVIIPHLISVPDEAYLKDNPPVISYFLSDRNLPKPPFTMPSFLYLLSYGFLHPETKIKVDRQDYVDMEYFRMILNSIPVFYKLTPGKDTIQAEDILKPIEEFVKQSYPDYLSHPWIERVAMVQDVIEPGFLQYCIRMVELHRDELVSLIYLDCQWPADLLAQYEYFVDRREGHWLGEVFTQMLDPASTCQTAEEFINLCLFNFLKIRVAGWSTIMRQQAGKHLKTKVALFNTMKKISCNDNLISSSLSTTIKRLNNQALDILRLKPSPFEHLHIQRQLQQVQAGLNDPKYQDSPQLHRKLNELIIYGICKLKMSPDNFESKEKFFQQVIIENKKMITKDIEKSYLESLIKYPSAIAKQDVLHHLATHFKLEFDEKNTVEDLKEMIEDKLEQYNDDAKNGRAVRSTSLIKNPQSISTQDALITLRNYFKLEFDQKNTVEDLIAIEGKIEQYNNHDFKNGKSFWSTFSQTKTLFGAAVGLLGVAIGTFVIMKLRAKK